MIPLFEGEHYADGSETENFAEGEGAAWCVAFTDEGDAVRESYVNLIPTVAGGTHESGLKDGLFGAVKGFIDMHALLPKGVKLMPEDVFSRASFVLSAKVLDPQFQGQIKERLNSRDALRLVSTYVQAGARALAATSMSSTAGSSPSWSSARRRRASARARRSRSARARASPCCPAS